MKNTELIKKYIEFRKNGSSISIIAWILCLIILITKIFIPLEYFTSVILIECIVLLVLSELILVLIWYLRNKLELIGYEKDKHESPIKH